MQSKGKYTFSAPQSQRCFMQKNLVKMDEFFVQLPEIA